MKTANLKNTFQKITKRQAINYILNGKTVGAFSRKKDYGFGYIVDDFDDLVSKGNKDQVKKIINLNIDGFVSGTIQDYQYYLIDWPWNWHSNML